MSKVTKSSHNFETNSLTSRLIYLICLPLDLDTSRKVSNTCNIQPFPYRPLVANNSSSINGYLITDPSVLLILILKVMKKAPKKNMSMQNLLLSIKTTSDEPPSKQCCNYTPRYDKENYNDKYIKMTQSNRSFLQMISPKGGTSTGSSLSKLKPFNKSKHEHKTYPPLSSVKSVSKFQATSPKVLSQDQPKRPRILSKTRYSNTFQEQFKLGKILGKGRFGNVCLGKHIQTGSLYAVKDINIEKMSEKLAERLLAEIKIQSFLDHQHCLQLYKFYIESKHLYLVLEFGETSLFDILRKKKYFSEPQTAYYLKQVVQALIYLHQNGVIHRDLKPQNIIIVNKVAKLADFGWATHTPREKRITFCGTLDYVSPEIVTGEYYDQMVDVWSVGVLCYELCTGHAPFESQKSREDTYKKIVNVEIKFPRHLSYNVQDFISRLLVRDPNFRMTLQECLQHPWMKTYNPESQ